MLLKIVEYRLDLVLFVVLSALAMKLVDRRLRAGRRDARIGRASWCGLAALVTLGIFVAERCDLLERARLRRMVEGFAPTYALEMSRAGHDRLDLAAPADDPLYLALIERQKEWLRVNRSIQDIYTFRRLADGAMVLVVDSETDYDGDGVIADERELRTELGEAYEDGTKKLDDAFAGEPQFEDQPFTDRWGTWVTAYAPMFDAEGRVEAVLGVDYSAKDWVLAIAWARASMLACIAILIVVLIAASALVAVLRSDLRERCESERVLLARKQQLHEFAETLKETNQRLEQAKHAAEAAAQAKTAFLANMSHEIRTPLTGILGFTDLMLQDADGDDRNVRRDWLTTIRNSGQHLLHVVNDVLDLAKIESGQLTLESIPCSPQKIVDDVVAMLRLQAESKKIQLVSEVVGLPKTILTDPVRLQQLLMNVVANAIKFTAVGSIRVKACIVFAEDHEKRRLQIEIADTGIGIPADKLEAIFDPFVQADVSVTRKYGGTGLGLSISRKIARALGGEITVASRPNQGSTFFVTLDPGPIQETAAHDDWVLPTPKLVEPADRSASPPDLEHARILLVDDGEVNRRIMKLFLNRAGAKVDTAEDGQQAIQMLGVDSYDLILMDMQMPVLDGPATTRYLRDAGLTTPIVALTANALQEDKDKCLAAGCNGFLTKPISQTDLIRAVSGHLHCEATA